MKEEFKKYLGMILAIFVAAALSIGFFFLIFRVSALRTLFREIINILMPFIYGAVIAYVLKPVCSWIEKFLTKHWHTKRKGMIVGISVAGSLLFGTAIIYIILSLLLPQLMESIINFSRSLPTMISELSAMLDSLFEGNEVIQNYIAELSDAGTESLSEWIMESILPYLDVLLSGLSDSVINVVGVFSDLVIGIVAAVYLLGSRKKLKKQAKMVLYSIFPERWAKKIIEELHFTDNVFTGFITGKLVDSAIIGVICFIGMRIMNLPYAILISVIVGITNIIPFFGPYIGAIPSAIILLTVSPMDCIIFIVFILILQQFDGNILGPRILGNSTGLSGIWVLFSIILFGGLYGFVGMLVGVPVFAVIYDIIRQLIVRGLKRHNKGELFAEYEAEYPRKSREGQ